MAITRLNNNSISSITALPSAVAVDNEPSFLASKTGGTNQSISNDTEVLLTYPNVIYDTDSVFSTSNNRFTPNVAGKYYVYTNLRFNTATDFELCELRVQKNGTTVLEKTWRNEYFDGKYIGGAVDMNGSSDYIEVKIYQSSGSSQDVTAYQFITFFGAYRIIT